MSEALPWEGADSGGLPVMWLRGSRLRTPHPVSHVGWLRAQAGACVWLLVIGPKSFCCTLGFLGQGGLSAHCKEIGLVGVWAHEI